MKNLLPTLLLAALKSYLDTLSKVSAQEFAGWSRPQQMAPQKMISGHKAAIHHIAYAWPLNDVRK